MAKSTQSVPQAIPFIERLAIARRQVQLLSKEWQEKKTGVSPAQAQVLSVLLKHDGVSQTFLVRETCIDRSTLADVVRRMLKAGLLARRRTREDARTYAVRLTPEGRVLASRVCKTQ